MGFRWGSQRTPTQVVGQVVPPGRPCRWSVGTQTASTQVSDQAVDDMGIDHEELPEGSPVPVVDAPSCCLPVDPVDQPDSVSQEIQAVVAIMGYLAHQGLGPVDRQAEGAFHDRLDPSQ